MKKIFIIIWLGLFVLIPVAVFALQTGEIHKSAQLPIYSTIVAWDNSAQTEQAELAQVRHGGHRGFSRRHYHGGRRHYGHHGFGSYRHRGGHRHYGHYGLGGHPYYGSPQYDRHRGYGAYSGPGYYPHRSYRHPW